MLYPFAGQTDDNQMDRFAVTISRCACIVCWHTMKCVFIAWLGCVPSVLWHCCLAMRKGIFHIKFKFLCSTHFLFETVLPVRIQLLVCIKLVCFQFFGILDTLSSLLSVMFEGYITLIQFLTIFFSAWRYCIKIGMFDTGTVWWLAEKLRWKNEVNVVDFCVAQLFSA